MIHEVFIITGVSGSGKTTIGIELSRQLNIPFHDGDDFHPKENIQKMKKGLALSDEDRYPWLDLINEFIYKSINNTSLVITCSALNQEYRTRLSKGIAEEHINWVHLYGDFDLIYGRMKERRAHFMPVSLLQSQYDAYKKPISNCYNVSLSPQQIICNIMGYQHEFGLIGLGVMGTSLARNFGRNNISLSIYNRHVEEVEEDVALNAKSKYSELSRSFATDNLVAFVNSLKRPRKVFLMVNAGQAVDAVIEDLIPLLEQGDFIMDGGNSHYQDTERRKKTLHDKGIVYFGIGVSGGEEGALLGPSIMPGGDQTSYPIIAPYLSRVAALNDQGESCTEYIGQGGAGHFVKMVHNGIEYAEMQLLCEMYEILKVANGYSNDQIAVLFENWKAKDGGSYLLEITIDILRKKNDAGVYILDLILDKAGNKGTGGWTTEAACNLGVAIPSLTAALFARYQSSRKSHRVWLGQQMNGLSSNGESHISDENLYLLYEFCRIANHDQGLNLIQASSDANSWNIDLSRLCKVWSAGCIIRSSLVNKIRHELEGVEFQSLYSLPTIKSFIKKKYGAILNSYKEVTSLEVTLPCIAAGINYFKYEIQQRSSANLIQAQRDYFGAHRYQLVNDIRGATHHTEWTKAD